MAAALISRARRADGWDRAFLAVAVAAFLVLLILGRGMTFYFDEWSFIDGRGGWDLATFMTPHNEHWSAGAVLIYKMSTSPSSSSAA